MKKVMIPVFVVLVGALCFTVYEQSKQQKKQEINQVLDEATQSLDLIEQHHLQDQVRYVQKMNADRPY